MDRMRRDAELRRDGFLSLVKENQTNDLRFTLRQPKSARNGRPGSRARDRTRVALSPRSVAQCRGSDPDLARSSLRRYTGVDLSPGAQLVHEQGVAAAVHASETALLLYRAPSYAGVSGAGGWDCQHLMRDGTEPRARLR
jgi:hypothetical protein